MKKKKTKKTKVAHFAGLGSESSVDLLCGVNNEFWNFCAKRNEN